MTTDSLSVEPTKCSTAVIEAVSKAENTDPVDLPPLYGSIDPDKLNALFSGNNSQDTKLTFRYHGYVVTVSGQSQVRLERA